METHVWGDLMKLLIVWLQQFYRTTVFLWAWICVSCVVGTTYRSPAWWILQLQTDSHSTCLLCTFTGLVSVCPLFSGRIIVKSCIKQRFPIWSCVCWYLINYDFLRWTCSPTTRQSVHLTAAILLTTYYSKL